MDKQKQATSSAHTKTPEAKPVKDASTAKAGTAPSQATTPGASGGHPLVFLMGAVAVAAGAALTVLPLVAREQAGIVNSFAKHGVTGMPLALTGLVLCVLAVVSRKKEDSAASKQIADQALLLEQLASDLALTRGGMQELRIEYVYLKDQVQTAMAQRETLDAQAKETDPQAAMFRLAASMDQLTGRLELRMRTQDESLAEQFAELRSELAEARTHIGEMRARIEEGLQAVQSSASDERQIEIEPGYEPNEDDYHVTVELEEEETPSLGLLDEFDDLGLHQSQKQSPNIRPSRRSTDLDSQVGLLPSRGQAAPRTVDEKLAALRELMTDPIVRKALEAARRV